MSHFTTVKTKWKDVECLRKALTEVKTKMGAWTEDQVEVHAKPVPLCGFQGDFRTLDGKGHTKNAAEAMAAEVVIRRQHVGGMANDIGFRRTEDGTFEAIISENEGGRSGERFYGNDWRSSVAKRYARAKSIKSVESRGYSWEEKEVEGKIELLCTTWRG